MTKELKQKITPRKSPRLSMNQSLSELPSFSLLTRTPQKDKNTNAGKDSPIENSSSKRKAVETPPNGCSDSMGEPHKKSRKKVDSSRYKKKSKSVESLSCEESEEDTTEEQYKKRVLKGKAKVDESGVNSDSDFMDEIPQRSGKNVKLVGTSTRGKPKTKMHVKKSTLKKGQKTPKNKRRHIHWKSYINVGVFDQLRERLNDQQFQLFRESPFGVFLDLHLVKVQPQLIRHILLMESDNDRDDMFIINVNGVDLHFGMREFGAITGLKCGVESEFVSDPAVHNRLMDLYFPKKAKISKWEFYEAFKDINLINSEDLFKMGLVYFIVSYLFAAEPKSNYVNKLFFDLVESGEYQNYTWGNLCFKTLVDKCRHKLANDPSSFTFGGFHLALQIWLYECCSRVDILVAQRKRTTTPRILNWQTYDLSIKFDYFKKTMFRRYGNQIKFSDIVLTSEELAMVDPSITPEYHPTGNHVEGFKKPSSDEESYLALKNEITNVRQDFKKLESRVDENLKELKQYIAASVNLLLAEIRSSKQQPCGTRSLDNELPMSDEQVNPGARSMSKDQQDEDEQVNYEVHSISKDQQDPESAAHQRVDAKSKNNPDSETAGHERVDAMSIDNQDPGGKGRQDADVGQSSRGDFNSMDMTDSVSNHDPSGSVCFHKPSLDDFPEFTDTQIIALDSILNESTPGLQSRIKNPSKYAASPYVRLSDGESSCPKGPAYFERKHPFDKFDGFTVPNELMNRFMKWVYQNVSTRRNRRKSAYTAANDKLKPLLDLGTVKVDKKDWFHTMVHSGRPWGDEHVAVIMYYLRKKAKYSSDSHFTYTTTDSVFMPWILGAENTWKESQLNMSSICPNHNVAQCIRGFKLLGIKLTTLSSQ